MVRLMAGHANDQNFASLPLAIGLFISVSALVALCAKRGRRVSLEHETESKSSNSAPRSPLLAPKKLVTGLSGKGFPFIYKKKSGVDGSEVDPGNELVENGFGVGGLWQKSILMGEKCIPPEFPGVIYYDVYGNRLSEPPQRSPRASPLPASYSVPLYTGV